MEREKRTSVIFEDEKLFVLSSSIQSKSGSFDISLPTIMGNIKDGGYFLTLSRDKELEFNERLKKNL